MLASWYAAACPSALIVLSAMMLLLCMPRKRQLKSPALFCGDDYS
jgi:hypothetical protein